MRGRAAPERPRAAPSAAPAGAATAAALALTLLLWSSAFPGIRLAVRHFSPGPLALLRFLSASAALAAWALLTRPALPERRQWGRVALVGFTGVALYHTFLNLGLTSVSAGAGSLLVNTAPIFAALLAALMLREQVRPRAWAGLALSMTGAALIAFGEGRALRLAPGVLFLLGAALAWAWNIVLQKPLLTRWRPAPLAACSVFIGTVALLVFLPGLAAELPAAPTGATLTVVYLGVFPIAVAYATWAYALSRLPASHAASFLYLVPVMAAAFAWLWLRELPSAMTVAGGCVALGGVVLVNLRTR